MIYGEHVSTDTLADHAEGLLGESEAGRVSAHLDSCADCRDTAMLLASVSDILASDNPGPMPAHYVARINATLADLAIAEPVAPRQSSRVAATVATTGGGAEVIDLASRRKIVITGLRRVSTVAASVVLLIGGVALGIESVQSRSDQADQGAAPAPQATTQETIVSQAVFDIPKDAVKNQTGNYVASDGTVYVVQGSAKTANKVLMPNGSEYIQGQSGRPIQVKPQQAPVVVQPNQPAKPTGPQAAVQKQKPGRSGTAAAPAATPVPQAGQPSAAASSPAVAASPAAKQNAAPATAPRDDQPVRTAGAPNSQVEGDPYVTESGQAYSEDSFASQVMDLMAQADQNASPSDTKVTTSSNAGDPAAPGDPAEPSTSNAVSDSTSSQVGSQTSQSVTADYTEPDFAPAAHGPASASVKARVLRCAAFTHRQVLAGDSGTWNGKGATVVVVPSDQPNQVIGYVFYGECHGQVTATQAQWEQRVDRPGTQQAVAPQATTPPKRVGDVTGSQSSTQVRSSLPASIDPLETPAVQPTETSAFLPAPATN